MYSTNGDGQNMPHFRGVEILETPAMHNSVLSCEGQVLASDGLLDHHSGLAASCKKARGRPKKIDGNLSPKRPRGRPRIHPPKDPNAPRRPRGRPRKSDVSSVTYENVYKSDTSDRGTSNKFENSISRGSNVNGFHTNMDNIQTSTSYMSRSSWHQILSNDLCEWQNNIASQCDSVDKPSAHHLPQLDMNHHSTTTYLQQHAHNSNNGNIFSLTSESASAMHPVENERDRCNIDLEDDCVPDERKSITRGYISEELPSDVMNLIENGAGVHGASILECENDVYGIHWQCKAPEAPMNSVGSCQQMVGRDVNTCGDTYGNFMSYGLEDNISMDREELSIDILQDLLELRRIK